MKGWEHLESEVDNFEEVSRSLLFTGTCTFEKFWHQVLTFIIDSRIVDSSNDIRHAWTEHDVRCNCGSRNLEGQVQPANDSTLRCR